MVIIVAVMINIAGVDGDCNDNFDDGRNDGTNNQKC